MKRFAWFLAIAYAAACSNASAPAKIDTTLVLPPIGPCPPCHATVYPASVSMAPSDRIQPTAVDSGLGSTTGWIWKSSDSTVASVSQTGLVTAHRVGTTTVTALETSRRAGLDSSVIHVTAGAPGSQRAR